MVTIQEIADKLGINKSTVSKALRNSGELNGETVRKIRKTAFEMGYSGKIKLDEGNKTIGIIYPELDDAIYTTIINILTQKIENEGFRCLAMPYNFDETKIEQPFSYLLSKNVCGIFLMCSGTSLGKFKEEGKLSGVSIVGISTESQSTEYDNIWINEKTGISGAVDYLVKNGHRNIAFIGDSYSDGRLSCFKNVMEENKIPISDELICLTEKRNFEGGYDGAKKLLKSKEKFTAIFAHYDAIALGAMRALLEEGIKVPEECSIIGFDDAGYSKYTTPSISTINSNVEYLCKVAIKIMKSNIYKRVEETQSVLINSEFVNRETTAAAKVSKQK